VANTEVVPELDDVLPSGHHEIPPRGAVSVRISGIHTGDVHPVLAVERRLGLIRFEVGGQHGSSGGLRKNDVFVPLLTLLTFTGFPSCVTAYGLTLAIPIDPASPVDQPDGGSSRGENPYIAGGSR